MMVDFLQSFSGFFIYPLVALSVSAILTFLGIRILPRLGYVDKPGGRHIHKKAIPRGGGIAVIVAFFLALGLYLLNSKVSSGVSPGEYWFSGKESVGGLSLFWRLFLPALPLCLLGLVDDRHELKSWIKLLVQLLVVVVVWLTEDKYVIFGWVLPVYVSLPLTALWVIIIINAFNLIDGLDGLASGLAIVSSVCMAIWFLLVGKHGAEAVTMLILGAACLGFLYFNFHPAKIFLGDTGSTFLGLIFAVIGLSTMD
ncbi:MAG: MraY family glycosyltransferase, partial [Victivallales bacterium]|nr:MraY family glycosyltransferase [Victivallales bacterium]